VASSAIKAAILVAVVAVGVFLLRGAFPEGATEPIGVGTSGTTSASPTGSGSPTGSPSLRAAKDVRVQVLNGTTQAGLAAQVTTLLRRDGYLVKTPANAATTQKTVVYYQPGFELEARNLKRTRFPSARVVAAPASVPKKVDLQVVLGADFQPA
jgi:LytR cell envelope-related transcriptional attenuator